MPLERVPISVSQLCELIEVDPSRFLAVEHDQCKREGEPRNSSRLWIVLEPLEPQPVGTFDNVAPAAIRALNQVTAEIKQRGE